MTDTDTDGDRRANPGARSRFDAAVKQAALDAAQQVAQISRRRQVVQSTILSAIAAGLIALVTILVVTSSNNDFAKRNALYDCRLFTQAAQAIGNFVNTDAALRERLDLQSHGRNRLTTEVLADFVKIIRRSTLNRLLAQQRAAEQVTIDQWRHDGQVLQSLGVTDCVQHLGG